MPTSEKKETWAQSRWSGELLDAGTERLFRERTHDVFCRQIWLLAVIALVATLPFVLADYQAMGAFAFRDEFLAFRLAMIWLPAVLLIGARSEYPYRRLDLLVVTYTLYVAVEAFLIMHIFRAEPIVVVSRMIFFVLVANTLIPMPFRNRLIVNGLSAALTMFALWNFLVVSAEAVVSLTVIIGSAYLFGFVVGTWLQRMRRAEFARRQELNRFNRELDVALKHAEGANSAKNVFLANMSHELRTPLNAIIGFADVLHRGDMGELQNSKHREYVSDIHRAGEHLLGMIDSLLDLSRAEAGYEEVRSEWISLRDVSKDWLLMVRELAARKGQRIAPGPMLPGMELYADPALLHRCVTNLLTNAVKYSGPDTLIGIAAERTPEGITIIVRDQGKGMTDADMARALRPFEQIDGAHERGSVGWGLGLPLAKSTAEMLGGLLELESAPGKGTTARIFVPAHLTRDMIGGERTGNETETSRAIA